MSRTVLWLIAGLLIVALAGCSDDSQSTVLTSEGTVSDPVVLTVGTSHNGFIQGGGQSYYKFTSTGTTHVISLTGTRSDLSWELYISRTYENGLVFECDTSQAAGGADEICTVATLVAGTAYYLTVREWGNKAQNYTILVQ